jgi:hypothetical protein
MAAMGLTKSKDALGFLANRSHHNDHVRHVALLALVKLRVHRQQAMNREL